MKSEPVTLALIGLSGAALAFGFGWIGQWPWAGVSLAASLLWLAMERRGQRQFAGLGLAATVGLAVLAAYKQSPASLPVLSVGFSLAAWDASRFLQRLAWALPGARPPLERRHLRRLAATSLAGLALALLVVNVQLQLPFASIFVLGLLLILALFQAMMMLSRWEV